MNFEIEVVTREQAALIFGITDAEFERWLSDDAAKDFAAGRSTIPQMPHRPGKPVKFLLADLREWLRAYLHRGGANQQTNGTTARQKVA